MIANKAFKRPLRFCWFTFWSTCFNDYIKLIKHQIFTNKASAKGWWNRLYSASVFYPWIILCLLQSISESNLWYALILFISNHLPEFTGCQKRQIFCSDAIASMAFSNVYGICNAYPSIFCHSTFFKLLLLFSSLPDTSMVCALFKI